MAAFSSPPSLLDRLPPVRGRYEAEGAIGQQLDLLDGLVIRRRLVEGNPVVGHAQPQAVAPAEQVGGVVTAADAEVTTTIVLAGIA